MPKKGLLSVDQAISAIVKRISLLKKVEKITKSNSKIQINMALNYGSREEIVSTIKKLQKQNITINEKNISKNLYTKNIPDPEILILLPSLCGVNEDCYDEEGHKMQTTS